MKKAEGNVCEKLLLFYLNDFRANFSKERNLKRKNCFVIYFAKVRFYDQNKQKLFYSTSKFQFVLGTLVQFFLFFSYTKNS